MEEMLDGEIGKLGQNVPSGQKAAESVVGNDLSEQANQKASDEQKTLAGQTIPYAQPPAVGQANPVEKAKEILLVQSDRLTVKTMAEYVAEYVMAYCENNAEFSAKVADPLKSFMNCIKYIKDHALEWLKEQKKIELADYAQGIGGDVPNQICYQWAVDYYNSVSEPPKAQPPKPKTTVTTEKGGKAAKSAVTPVEVGDIGADKSLTPDLEPCAEKKNGAKTEQISLLEMAQ